MDEGRNLLIFLLKLQRMKKKKKENVNDEKETKIEKLSFIQDYFYSSTRRLSCPPRLVKTAYSPMTAALNEIPLPSEIAMWNVLNK